MNLFLASLAVFSLPFLPNNSNLTIIASWVFVISGIKSLLNLNPLIRLDGYFLLADLLRIDNLRIRAFGSFFLRVRHLLYYSRLVQHPPPPLPRHRSKHERWALIPYALLSLTYIVAIISFFGYRGGQWLSSYIGFWGWLVALGVAGIFLISPLWQGWQGSEQTENITSSYINTIV
jgi:putative peptide zinc metalloprotease protein